MTYRGRTGAKRKRFHKRNTGGSSGGAMTKDIGKGQTMIKVGTHKAITVRGSYRAGPNSICYMSPRQMPFPNRYRCKFTTSITGQMPTATMMPQQFTATLNDAALPFFGGNWPNALPAINTLNPTGFTALANPSLYQNVRVYGSKISVEFLPSALVDILQVCVTPSDSASVPATVATAMAQPYTKQHFMSSSKQNTARGNGISNYISVHKFIGVTASALQNDLSGNYISTYNGDPNMPLFWVVNLTTPNNVATTSVIDFRCTIIHYVELFNATTAAFPEL